MDTTIGGTGPCCYHCQGLGCQAINPIRYRNGLTCRRVRAEGRPVAFGLDLLVWDRAFKYENKGVEFTSLCFIPPFHKVFAPLIGNTLIMDMNPGEPWDGSQHHVLDAGLGCCSDCDCVSLTSQPLHDPDDMDVLHARFGRHVVPPRALFARGLLRSQILNSRNYLQWRFH